ncbi:MAG: peroxiredoxin family protein [Rubritalea sp.]|jgi:peroxiredoxin family protein
MAARKKKLSIIVSRGTLDWAYPPLILASTAAALGYDAEIFFTSYGIELVKQTPRLQATAIGNPGMPMPIRLPVLLQAMPGMQSVMTMLMQQKLKSKGVMSIEQLRHTCLESGVKMIACEMTLDLFDIDQSDLLDEVITGGISTYLEFAGKSHISLVI